MIMKMHEQDAFTMEYESKRVKFGLFAQKRCSRLHSWFIPQAFLGRSQEWDPIIARDGNAFDEICAISDSFAYCNALRLFF